MSDLVEALREFIEAGNLIPRDARVLVGYSGGADSTCLLHMLHRLGFDAVAGHLHHGQRAEADEEMRLSERFATSMGLPFVGGHARVPKMAEELKIGLEEAGRKARYEFLQRAALKHRCDLVATAHTRDDHVETVLLNLVRGTGASGLRGIPVKRGNVVRPLLFADRESARRYCTDEGLWFHDDPANVDPAFSRSRIRLNVMPELRAINPGVEEAVARASEIVASEDALLNGLAASALEQAEIRLNGNLHFLTKDCEVAFERASLVRQPEPLLARGLRLAAGVIGGALDYRQTRQATAAIRTNCDSGAVTAEGGRVVVEWDEERVTVRDLAPAEPFRFPLTVPGETASDEFGWRFEVRTVSATDFFRERGEPAAVVDADRLSGELHFRTAEPGDWLVPLGMTGRRKLSDLFGEAGLTQAARRRLPIVCDMMGPIWVPALGMADRVKVLPGTLRALELRFGPQSPGEPRPPAT